MGRPAAVPVGFPVLGCPPTTPAGLAVVGLPPIAPAGLAVGRPPITPAGLAVVGLPPIAPAGLAVVGLPPAAPMGLAVVGLPPAAPLGLPVVGRPPPILAVVGRLGAPFAVGPRGAAAPAAGVCGLTGAALGGGAVFFGSSADAAPHTTPSATHSAASPPATFRLETIELCKTFSLDKRPPVAGASRHSTFVTLLRTNVTFMSE